MTSTTLTAPAPSLLQSTVAEAMLDAVGRHARYLDTQPLDLGDLFGRLFRTTGSVGKSTPDRHPVAHVMAYLIRIGLTEAGITHVVDVVDADRHPHRRDYNPARALPVLLTVEADGNYFERRLNVGPDGTVRLPGHTWSGDGRLEDWKAFCADLTDLVVDIVARCRTGA